MLGLCNAFLYALYQFGFKKENPYVIFQKATKFLFYWYMVVGFCVTATVGVLLLTFGPLILLTLHLPFVGLLLSISTFGIIMLMLIPYAFEVLGAKLLHDALAEEPIPSPMWDVTRLILGGISLALGLSMIHFLS